MDGRTTAVLIVLLAMIGGGAVRAQAQAKNDSLLVAAFQASTLQGAEFGSELADELERRLSASTHYVVVTPAMLADLLPPSVTATLWRDDTPSRTPLTCIRARQVAALAGLSLVVCGSVSGVEPGGFQLLPIVHAIPGSDEVRLSALRGSDASTVVERLVELLPE